MLLDEAVVVHVIFVFDLADDLLQHVLDGDDAGDMAVLVDHRGHVVPRLLELLQHHVEALALRHHRHRTNAILEVEAVEPVFEQKGQQVLRVQDALDVVQVVADHRKARVLRRHHLRQELLRAVLGAYEHRLRARNHDVPGAHVREPERTVDDLERFAIDDAALRGILQHVQHLGAVHRVAGEEVGHPISPTAPGFGFRFRHCGA